MRNFEFEFKNLAHVVGFNKEPENFCSFKKMIGNLLNRKLFTCVSTAFSPCPLIAFYGGEKVQSSFSQSLGSHWETKLC